MNGRRVSMFTHLAMLAAVAMMPATRSENVIYESDCAPEPLPEADLRAMSAAERKRLRKAGKRASRR